jgi:hypothetical protein
MKLLTGIGFAEYKPPRVPDTLVIGVKMYAELERKRCLQCEKEKSLDQFRYRKIRKNHESYCKACEAINNREWYRRNKAKLKSRDFVRNCKKFGLSIDQYWAMHRQQDGKCDICKQPEVSKRAGAIKNLAIDHCHKSGKIRSLLCHGCNTAIGLLREDLKSAEALLNYLKKFKN